MQKAEEGFGELVIPREDAAVVLELVDEALHQVTLFVEMGIVLPWRLPMGPGRNDRDRFFVCQSTQKNTVLMDSRFGASGVE